MAITRFKSWLLALGLPLLMTPVVAAQELEFVPSIGDLQLFEQPDLSSFGRGRLPSEGWFGGVEYLYWSISAPDRALIGNPNVPTVGTFGPGSRTVDTGNIQYFNVGTGPNPNVNEPVNFTGAPSIGVNQGAIINPILQSSTLDTSIFSSTFTSGARLELGFIEDGLGWFVSGTTVSPQSNRFDMTNVPVNFDNAPVAFTLVTRGGQTFHEDLDQDNVYGAFGRDRGTPVGATGNFLPPLNRIPDGEGINNVNFPLENTFPIPTDFDDAVTRPTVFHQFSARNRAEMWGIELMGMYRGKYDYFGATWEVFAGPRYLSFLDTFTVVTERAALNPSIFNDSDWRTKSENNMIGAQMGARVTRTRGRVSLVGEGRFMPAANFQSTRQQGTIRLNTVGFDVTNMQTNTNFDHAYRTTELSYIGELRLTANYQLFRSVALNVGWTGMFADGIARGSNMVVYRLPDMGIDTSQNRQNIFVNGVNFGVTVNR